MYWNLKEIGSDWDERWDALVRATPNSGFMQSSAWSVFKRLEGYTTPRFGLFHNGELLGGASLLDYQIHGSEGMFICADGPILPWANNERAREGLRLIAREAETRALASGGLGLRIEPRLSPPTPTLLRNWVRAPVDLNPAHSLVINLTLSDDLLLAQMHPKGRYNIRLSAKHGVAVSGSRELKDVRRFHSLFVDTAARNGFFAEPYSFFLNLGSALFPVGMAEMFFAEWNGEALAALLMITFGSRATYLYGGSSALHRHVMPTYALHWKAARTARERGCSEYDMYGFDPFDQPSHPYSGFSRFKRQFGGKRFDAIGAYDLIFYDRVADAIVQRIASI
jgi:lipid II:glycine glycyltransferase (peptidoglycan interpeptide bridge formation enzyme)